MTGHVSNNFNMPLVTVLISTFNGEHYLAEQLDSLLKQDYPRLSILVRDDGSKDRTLEILTSYKRNHSNIDFYCGENVGATASFYDLLNKASHRDGYFAFCDQDDIWLPNKVSKGVSLIEQSINPSSTVYFSKLALVDNQLNVFGVSRTPKYICFENAVVENVMTGATTIFGSNIKDLMLAAKPSYMIWHDWWLYLLATSLGSYIYDDEVTLYSRRHDSNQTQMRGSAKEKLSDKIKLLKRILQRKRNVDIFMQANFFRMCYQDKIPSNLIKPLNLVASNCTKSNFISRARLVFYFGIKMNKAVDTIVLKLLILLGYKL